MQRWTRGEGIPEAVLQRWNKQVYPLATYTERGELSWTIRLEDSEA